VVPPGAVGIALVGPVVDVDEHPDDLLPRRHEADARRVIVRPHFAARLGLADPARSTVWVHRLRVELGLGHANFTEGVPLARPETNPDGVELFANLYPAGEPAVVEALASAR